jgi:hypothetical protein
VGNRDPGLGPNPAHEVDVGVVVDQRVLRRFRRRLVPGARLAKVGETVPAPAPET